MQSNADDSFGRMLQMPQETFLEPQFAQGTSNSNAVHRILSANRLHLQHGPIDLLIIVDASEKDRINAFSFAVQRFDTILEELVAELQWLRSPWNKDFPELQSSVAKRMVTAVQGLDDFITPMAAVAGAVADEIRDTMIQAHGLERVMVNNGGDIALWLKENARLRLGVINNPDIPTLDAEVEIDFQSPVRGVATSGWKGRSQSLGIADAVTVLAPTTAHADAAATLIANAVNINHPAIIRKPASELVDNSDLGEFLVTIEVGRLPDSGVNEALERGIERAKYFINQGWIETAYLSLQQNTRIVQNPESRKS
ncbi:MAG: UPF0280 family protein [SAR324 cluster bacterium]|nr:UPF0280 family protein [SAR324 cluster bacterium]